ncbi:MAG: 3-deoxy-manno-octulosonate cytidylyltransferase [Deltaproteobacteria bacterium]|nr:3-deoxy-manno-octulosonate cytidylyltransferase [Deltaproteobacteria bacterium]MBW1985919.1 3-deoxy-manno-octulosonate cytidylyltransferase [Deltaproteobacteria bacterium]
MNDRRLVAIIPARYGSNRFPGKPLALIAGQPMVQRVYARASQVKQLTGVWVATDDRRIADCVQGFGGQVLMTRPDHPSGTDRLAEAAARLGLAPPDVVINIQGDQPAFPVPVIDQLIQSLLTEPEVAMATLASRLTNPQAAQNPNVVKVVFDQRHQALYFSRAPIPFWRDAAESRYFYKHIGIYGYSYDFLRQYVRLPPGIWEQAEKLEQLRALEHGFAIRVVETQYETLEVDVPEDIARVESYLMADSL